MTWKSENEHFLFDAGQTYIEHFYQTTEKKEISKHGTCFGIKSEDNPQKILAMVLNSLRIFFRKISKNDIYSIINLVGLSIGITVCLLIFLFISDEVVFDRHNEHVHTTYRVLEQNKSTGASAAIHAAVMHNYIHDRIPGIEKLARLFYWPECVVNAGEEPLNEKKLIMADPEFLDILTFHFIEGDPETALSEPSSIIITKEAAKRHFGNKNPLGETIVIDNMLHLVISGVVENFPPQSHLDFNLLGNFELMESVITSMVTDWHNSSVKFYVRTRPDADPVSIADQITQIVGDANESFRVQNEFYLQPLTDVRLRSAHVQWDQANRGDIRVVVTFLVIALLILSLACFNFVNLSVATAIRRAREIGIKKVLGASRRNLIIQFILETSILVLVALFLALLLTEIFIPFLNNLTGKDLSIRLFSDPAMFLSLLGLFVVVSALAGAYPAFVISRYKAIHIIKGDQTISQIKGLSGKRYRFSLRQFLIMLQFSASTALIIASLTVFSQMQYLSDRSPGYQREGLIAVTNPFDEHRSSRAIWLKEQMLQHTGVENVSFAFNLPPGKPNNYGHMSFEGAEGRQNLHVALISVEANFFNTMQSQILSGRDFSEDIAADRNQTVIINQAAHSRMGGDAIMGETLQGFYDGQARQVVGIVEDIHYESLHERAIPMVFFISKENYPQYDFNILIRYQSDQRQEVLTYLENTWSQEAPQWPLQLQFVDQQYNMLYQDDQRMMVIVSSFSGLAILLSVLGLIGLAVYAAATKTKEIGIRKVLGASTNRIARLAISEYSILVLVSNLLAWPAAYLFVSRWLDNFAYRIDLNVAAFLIPSLVMYLIAIVTIGLISYRAASQNPIEALRNQE